MPKLIIPSATLSTSDPEKRRGSDLGQRGREWTSVISAVATFAVSTASLGNPMLIGGEEVKWIRVGATYGGEFTLAYITASGKELRLR